MRNILFSVLLILSACTASQQVNNTLVLDYDDFGPQVIAHELIGKQWWQWQTHGDSRPRKYEIKVVVYRNISLEEVKRLFPVVPDKQQDYRYVAYADAIAYLDKIINDNVLPELTKQLESTRKKIMQMT